MCDSYFLHSRYQRQRKQAAHRCFLREKLELKRKAEKLITENIEMKIANQQVQREAEDQMAKVVQLKSELIEKRLAYDKVQKELERKQRLKEEQNKRELEMQKEQFEKHALIVKEQAERFKMAKQAEIKQVILEQQAVRKQTLSQMKIQIEAKAPDVSKRQYFAETAIINKLEDKKRKEYMEEERVQRIQAAIETYSHRPLVERDVRRMRGETESFGIRRETKEAKPIFNNPGYYDDKLMTDTRFKLQTRLFEAGIVNNDYARALFNQMSRPNNSGQ